MKRDQSLLFTAVPEEDSEHPMASSEQPFILTSKKSRPKFLNLKSISMDSNSETKSSKAGPGTPFCGQRSVCSTPLSELKKFVHMNPLSICKNNEMPEEANSKSQEVDPEELEKLNPFLKSENVESPTNTEMLALNVVKSSTKIDVSTKTFDILHNTAPYLTITSNFQLKKKHSSLIDLTDIEKNISKDSSLYFRNKNKTFVDIGSPVKRKKHLRSKSVSDPLFPVHRQDGTALSRWCYDECIANDLEMVEKAVEQSIKNKIVAKDFPQNEQSTIVTEFNCQEVKSEIEAKILNPPVKMNKEHRKSLTLPLKSLATEPPQAVPETSINRRYSMGVQLTPLLSKLSMLAFEERSSGFCSRDTTPCDYRGATPTQSNLSFPFGKFKPNKEEKAKKIPDDVLQKCVLFVCGQQDLVLMMLLREEACEEPTVIKKMVRFIECEKNVRTY